MMNQNSQNQSEAEAVAAGEKPAQIELEGYENEGYF